MKTNSIKFLISALFFFMLLNPLFMGEENVQVNLTGINSPSSSPTKEVDYLIIASVEYEDEMQALAEWKAQKGIATEVITVSNIAGAYSGRDYPEQIKNCIIDYEEKYGLDWVLLAGDYIDVPTRQVDIPDTAPYFSQTVSCDSYYADLSSDWNDDDDNY